MTVSTRGSSEKRRKSLSETSKDTSTSKPHQRTLLFSTFVVIYLIVMFGIVKVSKLRKIEEEEVCEVELPSKPQKGPNVFQKLARGVRQIPKLLRPKIQIPSGAYEQGFTEEPHLSKEESDMLVAMSIHTHRTVEDLTARVPHVTWGNNSQTPWYPLGYHGAFQKSAIERLDGATLLYTYYVHMRKKMKDPYDVAQPVYFPRRLCKKGCSIETAIEHTLEWREKYKPWLVPPSAIEENQAGWCYHRGFAKPTRFGRHAMVWSRPGKHAVIDPLSYFRVVMNTMDRAIADSLSHGHAGKINIVVDCEDYEWYKVPDISHIQQAINMLADHYPNRLGLLVLVNVSKTVELLLNIIFRLIPPDVRHKIHLISGSREAAIENLEAFVDKSQVPSWLGGSDSYSFDANTYYPKRMHCSEAEARQFLKTMPYHAR